jgi:hypothetical protein
MKAEIEINSCGECPYVRHSPQEINRHYWCSLIEEIHDDGHEFVDEDDIYRFCPLMPLIEIPDGFRPEGKEYEDFIRNLKNMTRQCKHCGTKGEVETVDGYVCVVCPFCGATGPKVKIEKAEFFADVARLMVKAVERWNFTARWRSDWDRLVKMGG